MAYSTIGVHGSWSTMSVFYRTCNMDYLSCRRIAVAGNAGCRQGTVVMSRSAGVGTVAGSAIRCGCMGAGVAGDGDRQGRRRIAVAAGTRHV